MAATAQSEILSRAATGEEPRELLDGVCRMIEEPVDDVVCTILLVDGPFLRPGAGPNMPGHVAEAFDGVRWGPSVGSCGTTAHTGTATLVEDIAADPRWDGYGHVVLPIGFGLAVVRELAHANQGEAWYEPAPRGGACFALRLHGADAD